MKENNAFQCYWEYEVGDLAYYMGRGGIGTIIAVETIPAAPNPHSWSGHKATQRLTIKTPKGRTVYRTLSWNYRSPDARLKGALYCYNKAQMNLAYYEARITKIQHAMDKCNVVETIEL